MSHTIKLTDTAIKTLKSFTNINSGMLFRPGHKFEVAHKLKEVIGFCDVGIEIPERFAIYDMAKFLGVMSLHDKDTLVLEQGSIPKTIVFKSKNATTKYRTTDETNVTSIPETFNLTISDKNAETVIFGSVLDEIKSVSNSLALPHVVLTNENGKLVVKVTDIANDASDEHQIYSDSVASGEFVNVVYKSENLSKLMSGFDYTLIANKKFSQLVSLDKKLEYFVSLEVDKK